MARETYKCNFPLFEKIEVNGDNTHPIYKYLRTNTKKLKRKGGGKEIPWNFATFFVKNGKVI